MSSIVVSTSEIVGSKAGKIAAYDWRKILKGFMIGGGGAIAVAAIQQAIALLNSGALDFGLGAWMVFLTPILSTLLNMALKFFQDTRVIPVTPETAL